MSVRAKGILSAVTLSIAMWAAIIGGIQFAMTPEFDSVVTASTH